MYYFGYGSNLNPCDWVTWCRKAGRNPECIRAVGRAWLPDAVLCFGRWSRRWRGGVLDLRTRIGSAVPGVLFEIEADGWDALDTKEGVGLGAYRRIRRTAWTERGEQVAVETYAVPDPSRREGVAPSPEYVETVRQGLSFCGLPDTHLIAAAESASEPPCPDGLFVPGGNRLRLSVLPPVRVVPAYVAGAQVADAEATTLTLDLASPLRVPGLLVIPADLGWLVAGLDAQCAAGPGRALVRVVVGEGTPATAWTYANILRARGSA